jgi:hypothetical protein
VVASDNIKKINFICPICKSKKDVDLPESIINQNMQLTTISIPKDMVCKHHFQAFVDKQFRIRGYQKVDFALPSKKKKVLVKNDDELFDNLILEGNHLEYCPKITDKTIEKEGKEANFSIHQKEMTLEEIYEEFWEFIPDDNPEFKEFIIKDKKRRSKSKIFSTSYYP